MRETPDSIIELQPIYNAPAANRDVQIGTERALLVVGQRTREVEATVFLKCLPRPRIALEVNLESPDDFFEAVADPEAIVITLPGKQMSFNGMITKSGFSMMEEETKGSITIVPKVEPLTAMSVTGTEIKKVTFHLVNFCEFEYKHIVTPRDESGKRVALNYVVLEASGWRTILQDLRNTSENIKALDAIGGYAITHVGQIERKNGASFTNEDAEEMTSALHYFLSMARGSCTGIALPVAFDDAGTRIWEKWGCQRVEQWQGRLSWFDGSNGSVLADILPGFFKKWQDEKWRGPLHKAIYLYVISNNSGRGTDVGIVLGQAALEVLAYAVKETKVVTKQGFDDLKASDQFRSMLSSLDIPLDIPVSLKNLGAAAQEFG